MFVEAITAFQIYSAQHPFLSSLFLLSIGALISILLSRSDKYMTRASFFAASNLTALVVAFGNFLIVRFGDGLLGKLWLYYVLAADIIVPTVIGLLVGWFAVERSRDAFGNRYAAALALVPVFNLVLLFTKGEEVDGAYRMRWAANGLGVMIGFLSIILARALQQEMIPEDFEDKVGLAYQGNPELHLQVAANGVAVPEQVDAGLTLVKVDAEGMSIHFSFEALPAVFDRLDLSPARPGDLVCTLPEWQPLLDMNATITQTYSAAGRDSVQLVYDSEICQF